MMGERVSKVVCLKGMSTVYMREVREQVRKGSGWLEKVSGGFEC